MDLLPTELLLLLPPHLPQFYHLHALALVSRRFHAVFVRVLYARDAASPAPAAPFWAAERGLLATLHRAHAEGADLGRLRSFRKPRGEMSDPYRPEGLPESGFVFVEEGAWRGKVRRYSAGDRHAAGWRDVATVGAGGAGGEAGGGTEGGGPGRGVVMLPGRHYWWHPVDEAAANGHAEVVRFLVEVLGPKAVLESRSRGLCELGCRAGMMEVGTVGAWAVDWAVHSVRQLAECRGHEEIVRIIEELR